jgi:hypothetical protein
MMTAIPVNAPIPRLVREWIVGNTKLCVIDWGKGFFVACYLDRAGIANNISDHDTGGGAVTAANQGPSSRLTVQHRIDAIVNKRCSAQCGKRGKERMRRRC